MKMDANKIVDNLNNEWANQAVGITKRIAILQEENGRLKAELEQLKSEKKEGDSE